MEEPLFVLSRCTTLTRPLRWSFSWHGTILYPVSHATFSPAPRSVFIYYPLDPHPTILLFLFIYILACCVNYDVQRHSWNTSIWVVIGGRIWYLFPLCIPIIQSLTPLLLPVEGRLHSFGIFLFISTPFVDVFAGR